MRRNSSDGFKQGKPVQEITENQDSVICLMFLPYADIIWHYKLVSSNIRLYAPSFSEHDTVSARYSPNRPFILEFWVGH